MPFQNLNQPIKVILSVKNWWYVIQDSWDFVAIPIGNQKFEFMIKYISKPMLYVNVLDCIIWDSS